MGVSYLCSFDMGHASEIFDTVNAGTAAVSSTIKRTGGYSLRCCPDVQGGAVHSYIRSRQAGGTYRSLFRSMRFYLYIAAYPTDMTRLVAQITVATQTAQVYIDTTGRMAYSWNDSASVDPTSEIFALNQWHLIEIDRRTGYIVDFYVNKKLRFTSTEETLHGLTGEVVQLGGTGAGMDLYYDDIVAYDSAIPTTHLNRDYDLTLLTPVSDVTVGDWKNGAGQGSNLFDAVNNVPPVGSTSATATSQIYTQATSGVDEYRGLTASYDAAGITRRVEQALTDSWDLNIGVSATGFSTYARQAAKSFIFSGGGVNYVDFRLEKYTGPTDGLVVEIRPDDAGNPHNSTVLATSSEVSALSLSQADHFRFRFHFSTPWVGTVGTSYWVVLRRTGALSDSAYYITHTKTSGSDTDNKRLTDTGTWVSIPPLNVIIGNTHHNDILAVQSICNHAQDVTTGSPKKGHHWIVENPTPSEGLTENDIEAAYGFDFGLQHSSSGSETAAVEGTFPTGWGTHPGFAFTTLNAINRSLGITVAVEKDNTTNRKVFVDFLGVYVMHSREEITDDNILSSAAV